MSRLRLLVLGSAAGGGSPQWNCRCDVCALAWASDPRISPRTQSSIALTADGESFALINAAPEILAQIRANPPLHPQGGKRTSPIRAVLLTNGDVDHVAGLLSLREGQPFVLHATPQIHDVLGANGIFGVLNPEVVERRTLGFDVPVDLVPGLETTIFPVPGKPALYLESADMVIGGEGESTIGVEFRANGRRIVHVPGAARVSDGLRDRLDGADVILFDGTLWRDDEMIRAGVGQKTGRRMGHMPISGEDGSISALAGLRIGRRVFIHINNTNPVLVDGSPERREAEDAGWEIAHDGMEILV